MSQELHYTSSPRGLKPGSKGFCTVACTPNMSGPLAERLEGLSGYRQVFPPHDPSASKNPVVLSHLRMVLGGKTLHILSRVGFAGLDYTERANKYAHHVVLEADERPAGGPAWVMSQEGLMQATWEGPPSILASGRRPSPGDRPPGICHAWYARVGDAGWAGILAEAFLADPARPSYLVFEPGMDLLPLLVEALALLPPSRRWDVAFSTYFTTLPQGIACSWRGVLDGSPEAKQARRLPDTLVIDLCRPMGSATGGALVEQARTGEAPPTALEPTIPEADEVEAQAEINPIVPPDSSIQRRRSMVAAAYEVIPELPGGGGTSSRRERRDLPVRGRPWAWLIAACLLVVTGLAIGSWYLKVFDRPVANILQTVEKAPRPSVREKESQKAGVLEPAPAPSSIAGQDVQPKAERAGAQDLTSGITSIPDNRSPVVPHEPSTAAVSDPGKPNALLATEKPIAEKAEETHHKRITGFMSLENPSISGLHEIVSKYSMTISSPLNSFQLIGHKDKKIQELPVVLDVMQSGETEFVIKREQTKPGEISAKFDICKFSIKDGKLTSAWIGERSDKEYNAIRDCGLRIVTEDGVEHYILLQEPRPKAQTQRSNKEKRVLSLKHISIDTFFDSQNLLQNGDIYPSDDKSGREELSPIATGKTTRRLMVGRVARRDAESDGVYPTKIGNVTLKFDHKQGSCIAETEGVKANEAEAKEPESKKMGIEILTLLAQHHRTFTRPEVGFLSHLRSCLTLSALNHRPPFPDPRCAHSR